MEWVEKMNNAMDYVEAHFSENIDYRQLAKIACCSEHQFHRFFSYVTNITLAEYIRRRRLTQAALDLKYDGAKVVDVALKYGYKSPEAFSRAFKNMHGVMPVAVRNKDTVLKAYPRMTFNHPVNGYVELDYRIVRENSYKVCGIAADISATDGQTINSITNLWNKNIENGTIGRFHNDIGLSYDTCLNAALYNYHNGGFSYMICYRSPNYGTPAGYSSLYVPSATWAVFSTPRHKAVETTEHIRLARNRIFLEWFPSSGYKHANTPELEIFNNENSDFTIEVWVPITKAT